LYWLDCSGAYLNPDKRSKWKCQSADRSLAFWIQPLKFTKGPGPEIAAPNRLARAYPDPPLPYTSSSSSSSTASTTALYLSLSSTSVRSFRPTYTSAPRNPTETLPSGNDSKAIILGIAYISLFFFIAIIAHCYEFHRLGSLSAMIVAYALEAQRTREGSFMSDDSSMM
jgi:hypothetical protein